MPGESLAFRIHQHVIFSPSSSPSHHTLFTPTSNPCFLYTAPIGSKKSLPLSMSQSGDRGRTCLSCPHYSFSTSPGLPIIESCICCENCKGHSTLPGCCLGLERNHHPGRLWHTDPLLYDGGKGAELTRELSRALAAQAPTFESADNC